MRRSAIAGAPTVILRSLAAVATVVALAACTPRSPMPPPPASLSAVKVADVVNKTGDNLVISGDSYIARYVGMKRRTVPDVLRDELREALRDAGLTVADSGAVPVLKIVLQRFEPDLPQLAYVDTTVVATLTDVDGKET